MNKLQEKEIILYLFNMVVFFSTISFLTVLSLLFLPKDGPAQCTDANDKTISSLEDNDLENGQNHPAEAKSASSISYQPNENPIILEKSKGTRHKEDIGNATFFQDHRNKLRSKDVEKIKLNL